MVDDPPKIAGRYTANIPFAPAILCWPIVAPKSFARNLFVNHRARPSINLIRACALDGINPVEFFTEGDVLDDGKFYPDRGDIVQLSGKTILVLTKEKHNRETHSLTGVTLVDGQPDITSLATITG